MNKKASGRDLLFILVVLFAIGICFFVSLKTYGWIMYGYMGSGGMMNTSIGQNPQAAAAMVGTGNVIAKVDYFFILAFFFLIIAMMVTSFLVDVHPIFFVIFIIVWVLAIVVGAILTSVYNEMIMVDAFSTMSTDTPFMYYLFTNLAQTATILGFLLCIVMFVKVKYTPQYGSP